MVRKFRDRVAVGQVIRYPSLEYFYKYTPLAIG